MFEDFAHATLKRDLKYLELILTSWHWTIVGLYVSLSFQTLVHDFNHKFMQLEMSLLFSTGTPEDINCSHSLLTSTQVWKDLSLNWGDRGSWTRLEHISVYSVEFSCTYSDCCWFWEFWLKVDQILCNSSVHTVFDQIFYV